MTRAAKGKEFDVDILLHPAGAYRTPMEVVNDPDITIQEKRAILAAWASDACAVEATPELRRLPSAEAVLFDDIMDALKCLDAKLPLDRTTASSLIEHGAGRSFIDGIVPAVFCSPERREVRREGTLSEVYGPA